MIWNSKEEYKELFDSYREQGARPSFVVYTDGSSRPHKEHHSGGWSFLVMDKHDNREQEMDDIIAVDFGGELETTNGRTELLGIVNALKWLPEHCDVEIRTDSQVSIGVLSGEYTPKKNIELVEEGVSLIVDKDISVEFVWVKGHADDLLNNYVDKLTNVGSAEAELQLGLFKDSF